MKRQRITLEALAGRANLELAAWKAMRGKRHRAAAQAWLADADARLDALAASILQGRAPQGRMTRFTIHDPKRREIAAACLDDRVLHHAIVNLAEARFERALSDAAFACRPGRGVHAAVAAVQRGLRHHAWVVHVDIDAYFASIDHAVLLARLARLFAGRDFLALLGRIVAAGSRTPGRGLPIGSLTSQHFANLVLDSADRLLPTLPGVHAPVRYMDDIAWFCHSRDAAVASLARLRAHLREDLHLELKPRVVLRPAHRGLRYCGFRVYPGLLLPSPRKRRRYAEAMARLQAAQARGDTHGALLQRAYDAQHAALLPAQTLHWRRRPWWGDGGTDGDAEAGEHPAADDAASAEPSFTPPVAPPVAHPGAHHAATHHAAAHHAAAHHAASTDARDGMRDAPLPPHPCL
jgi:hypothetical protein